MMIKFLQMGILKSILGYDNYIVKLIALFMSVDNIDIILGNDWLVQYKTCLNFQNECCAFYKGRCNMIVYVDPMQSMSSHSHRLTTMQFKRSIYKGQTLFLIQLIAVIDNVEDKVEPLYVTMLD